jgi:hypothetical protein
LRAAWVESIPRNTWTYQSAVWDRARPLVVQARRGGLSQAVRMQAIHDGRSLAILALWLDQTESLERRSWVWQAAARQYGLLEAPVDQVAIEWPLAGDARACMLAGGSATWDAWLWRAGWTNLSGIAEDGRLIMTAHPPQTAPESVEGSLYPSLDGRERIEVRFEADAGRPGVVEAPRPRQLDRPYMPGAVDSPASGSVADVEARGLYETYLSRTSQGYWFDVNKKQLLRGSEDNVRGFYFVTFIRRLATDDVEGDIQLRLDQPAPFAVAIWDGATGGQHFTTAAIRLTFQKIP